jgi:hypothetical protein
MNPTENLIRKCIKTIEWWDIEVLSKIMQRLHHGDWNRRSIKEIFGWIEREMKELKDEVDQLEEREDVAIDWYRMNLDEIIDECCDVSAIAMMLAERCNSIKEQKKKE